MAFLHITHLWMLFIQKITHLSAQTDFDILTLHHSRLNKICLVTWVSWWFSNSNIFILQFGPVFFSTIYLAHWLSPLIFNIIINLISTWGLFHLQSVTNVVTILLTKLVFITNWFNFKTMEMYLKCSSLVGRGCIIGLTTRLSEIRWKSFC